MNETVIFLQGETIGQTYHTPSIVDDLDISEQTQATVIQTTSTTTSSAINSSASSTDTVQSHRSHVIPITWSSITESTADTTSTNDTASASTSSASDTAFLDGSSSNTSSEERRPTDTDEFHFTGQAEMADKSIQRISFLTINNGTDSAGAHDVNRMQKNAEDDGALLQQLYATDEAVQNISESEEIGNSSLTAVENESFVADSSLSPTWTSRSSTTATARPLTTAWLFADADWSNEDKKIGEHRQSSTSRATQSSAAFPAARFGSPWKLFQRQSRPPARRRTGYRQILASSPIIATGRRTMTDRQRKRALLRAYLLSGLAGKDLPYRRAMNAAMFFSSKLSKPPTAAEHEVGRPPQRASDAEFSLSVGNRPTEDISLSATDSDRAYVTTSWTDSPESSSSTWNANSSLSVNDSVASWMSANNMTSDEGRVSESGAQQRQKSSDRAAAAAIIIPIIVGFLESLARKQFSLLDLTLAVCGTAAAVLGVINLVVFVVHLLRTKRGKFSFHNTEHRRSTNGRQAASSSLPSSVSASRSSSDSTPPPPPPPPPPLPLTGFGAGLSRSSREVCRRDVLADDETLRIRPLTFKRPLTDWGFTSSHGLTATTDAAVAQEPVGGGVTITSTGSDASSSGIESTGGRSDAGSTRRARMDGGNMAMASSVITNYAYCGNDGVNKGIVIDVDDFRDQSSTSPSHFVFGRNYGQRHHHHRRRHHQICIYAYFLFLYRILQLPFSFQVLYESSCYHAYKPVYPIAASCKVCIEERAAFANKKIVDKPRDTFRGQSRSPNMVPLHMLDMVSC